MSLVDRALNDAVLKEAKKLIDITALAEQVADKFEKDFKASLKRTDLVDEDSLRDMMYDTLDWGKLSKAMSKRVNDNMQKAFK